MIKQIPILFSTPMVQAILEGRKTQTRRTRGLEDLTKVHEMADEYELREMKRYDDGTYRAIFNSDDEPFSVISPYGGPGDLMWVRESFAVTGSKIVRGPEGELIEETPTYTFRGQKQPHIEKLYKWKPSIHMPKAACRIWLEVLSVRVERLQKITSDDAIAEGVTLDMSQKWFKHVHIFEELWGKINSPESWNSNPWVWVVEFKKVER
jgi:hypothetical protein